MKKITLALALLFTVSTTGVFAQTKIPSAVETNFHNKFAAAGQSAWTTVQDLYKVEFTLNNEYLTAYFNAAGEIVASSRNITVAQLPIALRSSLDKHLKNSSLSSLFEVDGDTGIHYYAKISDKKQEILLQSNSYGEWMTN